MDAREREFTEKLKSLMDLFSENCSRLHHDICDAIRDLDVSLLSKLYQSSNFFSTLQMFLYLQICFTTFSLVCCKYNTESSGGGNLLI